MPIQRTKVTGRRRPHPFARAEALFSADIERQFRLQLVLVLLQEPDDAAKVVIMTMAQHQSVEPDWIDGQQIDVVVERFGREAEIH